MDRLQGPSLKSLWLVLILWLAWPACAQSPWQLLPHHGDQNYRLLSQNNSPLSGKPPSQPLSLKLAGCWSRQFDACEQLLGTPYLLRDGRTLLTLVEWDHEKPHPIFVLLGKNGQDLWRTRFEQCEVAPLIRRIVEVKEPYDDVLWTSADQQHVFLRFWDSLAVLEVPSGKQVATAPWLIREFGHAEADTGCLLRAAPRLPLTPEVLTGLRARLTPQTGSAERWLQLGWRARLGDQSARARLYEAPEPDALEGLALLGPAAVRPALLTAMLSGKGGWELALGILGREGDAILLQAFQRVPLTSPATGCLVKAVAGYHQPELWDSLVRLANRKCPAHLEATFELADYPPAYESRLVKLLEGPSLDHRIILQHFQREPCQAVSWPIVKHLQTPRIQESRADVLAVLQFQNRVNFGFDVGAWERWLSHGLGRPAAEKARLLEELHEPTAVLWQAQIGQLRPAQLQHYPRLRAMWPVSATLSPDAGRLLTRNDGGYYRCPRPVCDGRKQAWQAASGRALARAEFSLGRFTFTYHQGWKVSGQSVSIPENQPICWALSDQAALFGDEHSGPESIFDAERCALYPWKGGKVFALSPSRPEAASLVDDCRVQIFDWRERVNVLDLEVAPDVSALTFSDDGNRLLLNTPTKWTVYDRGGKPIASGSGYWPCLSPDGERVVSTGYEGESLRVLSVPQPGKAREVPSGGCREPRFLPHSRDFFAAPGENLLSLLDSSNLREKLRFWGPNALLSVSQDGRQFSGTGDTSPGWRRPDPFEDSTWIWQRPGPVPAVPPEKQSLLCELWTGMHLRGGMAVPLTPAEYAARVRRWQQDGGGSWYADPQDLVVQDPDRWLTLVSALAVAGIVLVRLVLGLVKQFHTQAQEWVERNEAG